MSFLFFFFNDPAPTEIYTLSLHDALPICRAHRRALAGIERAELDAGAVSRPGHGAAQRVDLAHQVSLADAADGRIATHLDRKSTRLNSSHSQISYAVFCLKKKNKQLPIDIGPDIRTLTRIHKTSITNTLSS